MLSTTPRFRAVSAALLLTLAFLAVTLARSPLAVGARPNVIVIQTDDQTRSTLKGRFRDRNGRSRRIMPNAVRGIVRSGAEFRNYYASSPVCGPSRASLLTGQYPANSGVMRNSGPAGGWTGWRALPTWTENVPVTLQRAGYRTSHFGKLLNGYHRRRGRVERTVPPGWDRWFTISFVRGTPYYGYRVNDDGRATRPFGNRRYRKGRIGVDPAGCRTTTPRFRGRRCFYLTDLVTRRALREIRRNRSSRRPFYMQIDYQAPHGDRSPPLGPTPASRYLGSAARTPLPRNPAFNEANMSDKPRPIRRRAGRRFSRQDLRKLTGYYRRYVEAMRGVDDGVGAILKTLRKTGQLRNTYVFYLTDHGQFFGEHRFGDAKFLAYEPAAHTGMAVRGPGIAPRTRVNETVGNIDVPATVVGLAGARPDYELDGRSLRRFWRHPGRHTRRPFQISLYGAREAVRHLRRRGRDAARPASEPTGPAGTGAAATGIDPGAGQHGTAASGGDPRAGQPGAGRVSRRHGRRGGGAPHKAPAFAYRGFRVGPYKFIRYRRGRHMELYDLSRDPFELRNRARSRRYRPVLRYMRRHLPEVVNCRGESCRAELPPWPQPR